MPQDRVDLRAAQPVGVIAQDAGAAGFADRLGPRGRERPDMLGHVYTREHNAFNTSPLAVLNIARDSMASTGFSPATRVFEAAGAGACLITDSWVGLELFLDDGQEVLVARDGQDVAEHVRALTPERAKAIGEAGRARILREHTYALRGAEVDAILRSEAALKARRSVA